MIIEFVEIVAWVVLGLIPIVNPVTTAPIFGALSASYLRVERNQLARLSCLYATGILLTFLMGGALIMTFFGITIEGIRIAGGLVIGAIGFRMLFPSPVNTDPSVESDRTLASIAMTPLAMPMLSGPGSIAVILSISSEIAEGETLYAQLSGYLGAVVGILIVTFTCWLVLRGSTTVMRFLGASGIDAITRILGFLLIAMAVQFVETGLSGFLADSILDG